MPATPTVPDPKRADAEAWIEYMKRRAEANRALGLLPVGAGLAAVRHAALRAGDYAESEPAVGCERPATQQVSGPGNTVI